MISNDSIGATIRLKPFVAVALAVSTSLVLASPLWYSRYGFDFTDEGFYLVWISNPSMYDWSITQFGFVYHPLYKFLNGNIVSLRQLNILIVFVLAWAFVDSFFKTVFNIDGSPRWQRLAMSSAFATASLAFLQSWLPTPNYNSLALQALLISATGLMLSTKEPSRQSLTGWTLIGLGAWLAFMAKPSTAAALGVCTGLYLLSSRTLNVRLLVVALTAAMLMLTLSALLIDGSIPGFVARIQMAIHFLDLTGGGHTFESIFRIDTFSSSKGEKVAFAIAAATILVANSMLRTKNRPLYLAGVILLPLIFAGSTALLSAGRLERIFWAGQFQGLLILSVTSAAIACAIFDSRGKVIVEMGARDWLLACTLFVLPHSFAFGTNNNYWQVGSAAGLFWLMSGLIFLAPLVRTERSLTALAPLALATPTVVAALLSTGFAMPYRQTQPLYLNDVVVEVGKPTSRLILSSAYARYMAEAVTASRHGGFTEGTPVIDLSGQSPGILYAIGAKSVGQAWMIGGYPGSERVAAKALRMVSCVDLGEAWLLLEPNGPRSISPTVLESFAAVLSTDYESVATWLTAEGAGGYKEVRRQELLRPIRKINEAGAACETERRLAANK